MHFKQKEVELMILNKLYKNIEIFLESLERKLKLILGEGWIIQTHRQEFSEKTYTYIILKLGEISIHNSYQLSEFCKWSNTDYKKLEFTPFLLCSKKSDQNILIVNKKHKVLKRAIKRITARKMMLKYFN